MRIPPRSAKGTWLLAAAAWLSGCALAWWLLPVVPLAQWTVPEPSRLDFLPGGQEVVTRTQRAYPVGVISGPMAPFPPKGPVRVWELRSGRLLESYPPNDKTGIPPDPPVPPGPSEGTHQVVSEDGRVLAAVVPAGNESWEVGVWEVGSLRRLAALKPPAGTSPTDLRLNGSGRIVVARLGNQNLATFVCWEVASGRELLHMDGISDMAIGHDGDTSVTFTELAGNERFYYRYRLSSWDLDTGRERFSRVLECGWYIVGSPWLSPDGRFIAAPTWRGGPNLLGKLAHRLGPSWSLSMFSEGESMTVFDARSGRDLGRVAGQFEESQWSPDGSLFVTLDRRLLTVRVWDIPPRKPLTWFALAAAILALPFAGLAWRRSRRLRREVGQMNFAVTPKKVANPNP